MSLLTILLEGVLSYNPPVRKSVSRGKTAGDSKGRPGEMQAGRGGLLKIFGGDIMTNGQGLSITLLIHQY